MLLRRLFSTSSLSQLKRLPKRGSNADLQQVFSILDEGPLLCTVAVVVEGHPVITPTLFARDGDSILLHGHAASRTLRAVASGAPTCINVAATDGLVLARALFHHSVNYRSATVFGTGEEIKEASAKMRALTLISDRVIPGRWERARLPNEAEMHLTSVVRLHIREASYKCRTGAPGDDKVDIGADAWDKAWSGVLPLASEVPGAVQLDPTMSALHSETPDYIAQWLPPYRRSRGDK